MWYRVVPPTARERAGIMLYVKVKPRASKSSFLGFSDDQEAILLAIAAPPVDGEANAELIAFIAKFLGVRRADVDVLRGEQSRYKQLFVRGIGAHEVDETFQQHGSAR